MFLLLLGFLLGSPECTLKVSPNISLAPLRYLRVTTHLNNPSYWWIGTIYIVEGDVEVTRHQLFEGDMAQYEPKTRTEEFKQIILPEGEYEVQFVVATRIGERCFAKQPLVVKGEELLQ